MFFVRSMLALVCVAAVATSTASAATTFDNVTAQLWGNGSPGGYNLRIDWSESGLEPGSQVAYRVSFDVARTVGCINKSGKIVKTSRESTGFTSVEFTAGPIRSDGTMVNNWVAYYDGGGQNVAFFSTSPTCPGGHTPRLLELTYSNIGLTDNTNAVAATAVPPSVTYVAP